MLDYYGLYHALISDFALIHFFRMKPHKANKNKIKLEINLFGP